MSPKPTHPSDEARSAALEVDVRTFDDDVLDDARVTLTGGDREKHRPHRLEFRKATATYVAAGVRPGRYRLRAESDDLEAQEREIEVHAGGGREVVVLGKPHMPWFQRGSVRVPFDPHPELLAVKLRPATGEREEARLRAFARNLELEIEEVPDPVRQDDTRLFRVAGEAGRRRVRELLRRLADQQDVLRAGQVVVLRERSLSFLTDELLVRFRAWVDEDAVRRLAEELQLEILRVVPYSPNTYHLRRPGETTYDLLEIAANLQERDEVEWAEPNLVTTVELDAVTPGDYLWPGVWDRQLVDTPDAWQHLQDDGKQPFGEPDVILAMVDQGIQSAAGVPLAAEFSGTVSNGSNKVYQLYDFRLLVANNDTPLGDHGMGVSGVATAMANNASVVPGQQEGIAGAAPNCRAMGLIYPSTEADQADMYIWGAGFDPNSPRAGFPAPITPGADVFSTSIGFGAYSPISGLASAMLDYLTTYGRGGKGCLCFFSAGNANNNFTTYRPWAAYSRTFGMAASTLDDDGSTEIRAPYSGFGPVELCAPSHDQYPVLHNPPARYGTWSCDLQGTGNLIGHAATQTTLTAPAGAGSTTLDVASSAGFSVGDRLLVGAPGAAGTESAAVAGVPGATQLTLASGLLNAHPAGDAVATGANNYRNNFGGTSSATPLAAGVAALVLSAAPDLTWIEARQILRDSAVKIDAANTHPTGQWLDENGNPSVSSGLAPVYSQWYGYGRINAAQAVQDAINYPFDRDLVVRENLGDTGAVPATGAFWNSPDIWVRNTSPGVEGAAALPASYAAAGPHQDAIAGQSNWVYARVRNNGTAASLDYYVRIYITHFPGTEFTYPNSFIPTNRPGDPVPSPMTPGTYLIGEQMLSGLAAGADTVVSVEWPAALIPPETVTVSGMTVTWHPCLLLEVSPHDGPAPTGNHVWDHNNLAQKNISIIHPDSDLNLAGLVLGNLANPSPYLVLEVDRTALPRQVQLFVDLLDPKLTSELVQPSGRPGPEPRPGGKGCRITFLEQTRILLTCGRGGDGQVMTVAPQTQLETVLDEKRGGTDSGFHFELGQYQGRKVAFAPHRGRTRIPVAAGAGALTPIVVGAVASDDAPRGTYRVGLTQRDPSGRITGAAEVEVRVD